MWSGPEDYLPMLLRGLKDEDCTARRNAARALGRMGPAAGEALPALTCIATNALEDEMVRACAQAAVIRVRGSMARNP